MSEQDRGWRSTRRSRDVRDAILAVESVFEADKVNQKNRLYEAPMAIHASLDGVVTLIEAVGDGETLAESYTADYSGCVCHVVAALWPRYYGDTGKWKAALRSWLDDQETESSDAEIGGGSTDTRPADDASLGDERSGGVDTAPVADVFRAVERRPRVLSDMGSDL